jgi:hypothetical protein
LHNVELCVRGAEGRDGSFVEAEILSYGKKLIAVNMKMRIGA